MPHGVYSISNGSVYSMGDPWGSIQKPTSLLKKSRATASSVMESSGQVSTDSTDGVTNFSCALFSSHGRIHRNSWNGLKIMKSPGVVSDTIIFVTDVASKNHIPNGPGCGKKWFEIKSIWKPSWRAPIHVSLNAKRWESKKHSKVDPLTVRRGGAKFWQQPTGHFKLPNMWPSDFQYGFVWK